jgi:putative exosortase-associated protein (TIGR04073 family)
MRKLIFLFAATVAAAGLTGCQGPEKKLARGLDNTMEVIRWGDMRQNVEQSAVFSSPDVTYSYGVIHGFDQSVKRIGLGVVETVTFFVPNPHGATSWDYKTPVWTNSVPAISQYPDNYKPGIISGSGYDTDTYTGFAGGEVAPFVPGSRFKVFDLN